jgi:transposase
VTYFFSKGILDERLNQGRRKSMNLNNRLTQTYGVYFGIDVDKRSYSFTVKGTNQMSKSRKMPSHPEQLYQYIRKYYPEDKVLCAYEAGPTGYALHDYLKSRDIECFVVSPNTIPKGSNEVVKNNRIDSDKIALHLKAGTITSIRVPEGAYRELRHFVKMQEKYADQRRVSRQRIKSLLLFENLESLIPEEVRCWSARWLEKLKGIGCSGAVRTRLDMLLMDHEYACRQLLLVYRQMKEFIGRHEEIARDTGYLQSIPGIGFITAASILGKIGDPKGLRDENELAGFIGVAPREHSTGEKVKRGGISHLGDQRLRSLMIEAAWVAIRYDTELEQFYHRIMNRNHPQGAAQKAIVAVARKLTQRIYRVLKDQRNYVIH